MRFLGLAFLLILSSSPTLAGTWIREITPENIESLPFEFKFSSADRLVYVAFTVEVRPKAQKLSEIRERVGGRPYHCQETPKSFELIETGMEAKETGEALIYKFRVIRGKRQCFYFWQNAERFPGGDIYWISLNSPLLSGRTKPQSGRR